MVEHIKIEDESNRVVYSVPGSSTGPFAFNYAVFAAQDLRVYVGETLLILNDGYTVSLTGGFLGGYPGGTVTLTDAATATTVTIQREVPIERVTDFPAAGALSINSLNTEFDRIIAILQDLRNEIDGINTRIDQIEVGGAPGTASDVPNFATRSTVAATEIAAGIKSLSTRGWSSEGDGGHWPLAVRVSAEPTHTGSVRSVDRFMPDGSTSAGNGGWWEVVPHAGPLNFEAFGAVGDDTTDDTAALKGMNTFIVAKQGGVTLKGMRGKSYVIFPNDASAANQVIIHATSSAVRGVTIDFNGSRFHSKYTGEVTTWVIFLEGVEDWTVLNYRGTDDAGIRGVSVAGQIAGLTWGLVSTGAKRVKFLNCDLTGGVKGIQGFADHELVTPNAPEDVEITGKFTDIYYALALQSGPHDTEVDIATAGESGRSILAYNVMGLRGRAKITDGVWHNQQIHLSAFYNANSPWHAKIESDLKVQYDGTASLPRTKNLTYLTFQQTSLGGAGGICHCNVKFDFDVIFPAVNTGAPALFNMDSYTVTAGNMVLGTPGSGGHQVLLDIQGRVYNDVGAASEFMGLAMASQGWDATSTGVMITLRNMRLHTARPIVIGTCARGGVERTVLHTGGYTRETPARYGQFMIREPFDLTFACSDETTALTTGTNKIKLRNTRPVNLEAVRASLSTTQTSGSILTVDINQAGSSLLSTKLTIDNGETTSTTAATPPVLQNSVLDEDAELEVDIDQVGDGTAKGLKIHLIGWYL